MIRKGILFSALVAAVVTFPHEAKGGSSSIGVFLSAGIGFPKAIVEYKANGSGTSVDNGSKGGDEKKTDKKKDGDDKNNKGADDAKKKLGKYEKDLAQSMAVRDAAFRGLHNESNATSHELLAGLKNSYGIAKPEGDAITGVDGVALGALIRGFLSDPKLRKSAVGIRLVRLANDAKIDATDLKQVQDWMKKTGSLELGLNAIEAAHKDVVAGGAAQPAARLFGLRDFWAAMSAAGKAADGLAAGVYDEAATRSAEGKGHRAKAAGLISGWTSLADDMHNRAQTYCVDYTEAVEGCNSIVGAFQNDLPTLIAPTPTDSSWVSTKLGTAGGGVVWDYGLPNGLVFLAIAEAHKSFGGDIRFPENLVQYTGDGGKSSFGGDTYAVKFPAGSLENSWGGHGTLGIGYKFACCTIFVKFGVGLSQWNASFCDPYLMMKNNTGGFDKVVKNTDGNVNEVISDRFVEKSCCFANLHFGFGTIIDITSGWFVFANCGWDAGENSFDVGKSQSVKIAPRASAEAGVGYKFSIL
jgi:hypothetical protein